MVEYDEYGRPVEKAKKRKWSTYEPDYPLTFAVSVVNRETWEGIKDIWAEPKLKSPKGAAKKASKMILMPWYYQARDASAFSQPPNAVGQWLLDQRWEDLDFVVRPVTERRDVDLHQVFDRSDPYYSYWSNYLFTRESWRSAMNHVTSPPSGLQHFKEEQLESGRYASGTRGGETYYFEATGYHGDSTVIPLLDVAGE